MSRYVRLLWRWEDRHHHHQTRASKDDLPYGASDTARGHPPANW
jgi:hypothetical protein